MKQHNIQQPIKKTTNTNCKTQVQIAASGTIGAASGTILWQAWQA